MFTENEEMPIPYTCHGPNISPPLEFKDIPTNAKSMVLTIEDWDGDAKPWVHWLVYNIPPTVTGFEEGQIPSSSVDGICNGGTQGYEGPCSKYFAGTHSYQIHLYAIDKVLEVPTSADRTMILREIEGHIISEAVLKVLASSKS